LTEHRAGLRQIAPTPAELVRLTRRLCEIVRDEDIDEAYPHFEHPGNRSAVAEVVQLLVAAQGDRPFFWFDFPLPVCWNAPGGWTLDYVQYQWGHIQPKNSGRAARDPLRNLCLMSARCNNHLQSAVPMDELLDMLEGSKFAERGRAVLAARARLFALPRWSELMACFRVEQPIPRFTLRDLGLA
jgi:hypothetical protein